MRLNGEQTVSCFADNLTFVLGFSEEISSMYQTSAIKSQMIQIYNSLSQLTGNDLRTLAKAVARFSKKVINKSSSSEVNKKLLSSL